MSIDIAHDELYTIDEVIKRLKISRTKFMMEKKAGRVPKSIIMMGRELFPSTEVNRFLIEQNPDVFGSEVAQAAATAIKTHKRKG
ncbi:MAG: hypothetical protein V7707_08060 [Motiliproteus sp.]